MSDLATFQARFAQAVMAEEPIDHVSRRPEFAVYRNTSARGAVEALRATFATVDRLVGDEMFTEVALDFRRLHPPGDPVLSNYGSRFADFLAVQPWAGDLPYLADVARLDWLWLETLLAADRPALADLVRVDERRRIALHPATRFVWLETPAMTIWQAHRDPDEVGELAPEWRAEGALFTRRDHAVHAELIDANCYHLLQACATTIEADACIVSVDAAYPEADAIELFKRCLSSGALVIL